MEIEIANVISVTDVELDDFEVQIGHKLPKQVRAFFKLHNGGKPETNEFDIGNSNRSGINQFVPLEEIQDKMSEMGIGGADIIPIAWAEGGNYVVIDLEDDGKVCFWDHELEEPFLQLSPNIDEFLSTIRKFDPSSVSLKDGQVIYSWIDPDFLKQLKD